MDRRQLPLWFFTLALGAAATLPKLAAEGTFLDGEIYACLSRNAAAGAGSFWAPHFSATAFASWYEHPPLGIALGALPFRALGDHLWVEHLYSLLILLGGGTLIVAAWRRLFAHEAAVRALGWLPLLMWLAIPQITWAYANNMLEGTMSLFTFAAVWCTAAGLVRSRRAWPQLYVAAPLLILLAVLVKDIVGFFPLAAAPAMAVASGAVRWRRAWLVALAQAVIVAGCLGLLMQWPPAHENLTQFVRTQLVASLTGRRGETANNFIFLVKLFNTLLPPLVLTALLVPWRRAGDGAVAAGLPYRRWAFGLVALASAGSIPLVVSERQSLFYVLPSFPFFALGLAVLAAPQTAARLAAWRLDSRSLRFATALTALLLVAALGWSVTRIGTVSRAPAVRADVKRIVAYLHGPDGDGPRPEPVVEAHPSLWQDWGLETLLQRYGAVALSRGDNEPHWLIAPAADDAAGLPGRERVPLATTVFHLFRCGPR
jgi:hypothetical protein